jgi:hypothetical protein
MLDHDIADEIVVGWTGKTEGRVTARQLAALSLHHKDQTDDLGNGIWGTASHLKE